MNVEKCMASEVFDDDNDGYIFGLMENDENGECGGYVEWFATSEERESVIVEENMNVVYECKGVK